MITNWFWNRILLLLLLSNSLSVKSLNVNSCKIRVRKLNIRALVTVAFFQVGVIFCIFILLHFKHMVSNSLSAELVHVNCILSSLEYYYFTLGTHFAFHYTQPKVKHNIKQFRFIFCHKVKGWFKLTVQIDHLKLSENSQ